MKTAVILSSLLAVALAAPASSINRRQGQNLQTFTGALGGVAATPITNSGNADKPFQVKGNTFSNIGAALQRSCDQQFNGCANLANGGDATLSVSACADQKTQCDAAAQGGAGAANGQAAATGNANTGAAKNPCNQAANANAGANTNANADAAANAGNANANAGNGKKGSKGTNGAAAAANPCNKKRSNRRSNGS